MPHEHFFYSEQIDVSASQISIFGGEHHHLARVIRLRPGDPVHVGDTRGTMYECEILEIGQDRTLCRIGAAHADWGEASVHLHLAVGIIRENHWEWMIEKAVELGVSEITPLMTVNVVKKNLRSERSEKIIQAAAKQCGRGRIPRLNPVADLSEFCVKTEAEHRIILDNQGPWRHFRDLIPFSGKSAVLMVGPEGGFSKQEVDFAVKNDYLSSILGVRRLRTETAAAAALALAGLS